MIKNILSHLRIFTSFLIPIPCYTGEQRKLCMQSYTFVDIPLTAEPKTKVLEHIRSSLIDQASLYIVTPNPEMILESRRNENFKKALQEADMSLCDGVGLLWATRFLDLPERFRSSKFLNNVWRLWQLVYSCLSILVYPPFLQKYIPERITGADFFWDLIRLALSEKKRVFLLGAAPGVAEKVRERLITLYPTLQVSGTYSGSSAEEYDAETRKIIEESGADIVCVAFSFPAQELWMQRNLHKFSTPKVLIGLGGTFDYVSGHKKRAPHFIRKLGLEWFFRLLTQPWRYVRIYSATIRFVALMWKLKKDRGNRKSEV